MAGRMPLEQEDVDVVKKTIAELRTAGKLTSADVVQDLFDEALRLQRENISLVREKALTGKTA